MVMKFITVEIEFIGMTIFHIQKIRTWHQHIRIINIFHQTLNTIEFLPLESVSADATFL